MIINALTERKGAKTALIVMRSFRTGDSGYRESLDAADGVPDPAEGMALRTVQPIRIHDGQLESVTGVFISTKHEPTLLLQRLFRGGPEAQ